ncbi:hypothetical protein ABN763_04305 [Spongiivirga sp. MCCC 1A20706]|uniref:hypothetical protein n=1 Tax=Spongiivirga sp. MCCC 1A20706 TaxID=3160963 RepID=UPI003977673B
MKLLIKAIGFMVLMLLGTITIVQKEEKERMAINKEKTIPEVIELKGTVTSLEQGPCKFTNGDSISGTHIFLTTADKKTMKIHLGPTSEVLKFVENTNGKNMVIKAFHTNKLPSGHYVAKELVINNNITVLRNDVLLPFWTKSKDRS